MRVATLPASTCHLHCATTSCALSTCRRTTASCLRYASLRSVPGGRAFVATCQRLFELAKCAIEIAARTQTPARRWGSSPTTIYLPSFTSTLSAGKSPFLSALPQNPSCQWLMASQAGPRPFQSKINASSPSRTPCTPNRLRVTASRSRSTVIVARSLSRLSSRSYASYSASIRLVRHRIAHRRMASGSASTARSSRCYAVP